MAFTLFYGSQGSDVPDAIVSLFWVCLLLYWLVSAFNSKRYVRRNYASWSVRLLIVIVVFVIYSQSATLNYFVSLQRSVPLGLQWLGVLLCLCGIIVAVWARTNLGRNWGMPMSLKQDAELVTSGPYAYVRHPIYSGFLLAALGSCFVDVWWIVPLILLSGYFFAAAKAEEKIMVGEFGDKYRDYMKRSKMLIPFVF